MVCSLIDKYCTPVNGTTTTLIPTGQYKICRSLRYHNIIDTELNNLSLRINKINSNTTTEVHADSNNNNNNNNNNTIGLLVPKEEEGIDKDCPERCQLASIEFAAQRRAATKATRVTTTATTTAIVFSREYDEQIITPKNVDHMYRIVNTLTGKVGGGDRGRPIYGELTKSK